MQPLTSKDVYWMSKCEALALERAALPHAIAVPWWWPTVEATMYVGDGPALAQMSRILLDEGINLYGIGSEPDWSNLYCQRYHLWQWEQHNPGMRVADLKTVCEFGGGYGAMAIVLDRMGFRGEHYITDLEPFAMMAVEHLSYRNIKSNVVIGRHDSPDLLIGCFSLNETPIDERDAFMDGLRPQSFLFAYHAGWNKWPNTEWFMAWAEEH